MDLKGLVDDTNVANKEEPPPSPGREAYAAIIKSKILDETIIILKDRNKLNEIKEEFPDTVIYLPSEIRNLARFKGDADALRQIHAAKKKFEGWIYK